MRIQDEIISDNQVFRTIFCNHEVPCSTFSNSDFIIAVVDGGSISSAYAWTLVINNRSILMGAGSQSTSVDTVCEQFRLLLILKMNLFFGQSPEEVEQHCNTKRSTGKRILPDVFGNTRRLRDEEIGSLDSWFHKVLSLSRKQYLTVCQSLTAYERALHVLSSDPTLSYSLLVFVIESLANSHSDYQATWDDFPDAQKAKFDSLFQDDRISNIESSWTDDLREVLVDVANPKATKRFTDFALAHISSDLYDTGRRSKSQLRRSRIRQCIENAYALRSSFSHALKLLPDFLMSESYRTEEVEQIDSKSKKKTSYLTLRGLFIVSRSIILEFIEKQESVDLRSHSWIEETDDSVIKLNRNPAYLRMKNPDGQIYNIESQYAQNWFEDILVIYQDNYIEKLHNQISTGQVNDNLDLVMGIAISGSMAGRGVFRFDPSPSYDWRSIKEQALSLIASSKKTDKRYLQAIALMCIHLETMDGEDSNWDDLLKEKTFGEPLFEIERFVVDVIHDKTDHWLGKDAENIFEKYLKNGKDFIPVRIEIACMLEVARLFNCKGSDEGRKKWLETAYGDASLYPNLQNAIRCALVSDEVIISPQEILSIPQT